MLAKMVIGLVWIWGLGSYVIATDTLFSGVGRIFVVLLLAAHLVECVLFFPRLRRAEGGLVSNLLQTMLFGIVHVRSAGRSESAGS